MIGLEGAFSPCVCGRDFQWRKTLQGNWLVVFGVGAGNERWENWCKLISTETPLINFNAWSVLLVTTESPEEQLLLPLYSGRFDCATVRLLSDTALRVGPEFAVVAQQGNYPFTIVQVIGGVIVNRFT